MAHYAREALATRVNPDTIVFVWTVKFDLKIRYVWMEIFLESRREKLQIENVLPVWTGP